MQRITAKQYDTVVKTDIQIDIGQSLEINSRKGAKNFTGEGVIDFLTN